jgi:radical SAM superfamily enzyme
MQVESSVSNSLKKSLKAIKQTVETTQFIDPFDPTTNTFTNPDEFTQSLTKISSHLNILILATKEIFKKSPQNQKNSNPKNLTFKT